MALLVHALQSARLNDDLLMIWVKINPTKKVGISLPSTTIRQVLFVGLM